MTHKKAKALAASAMTEAEKAEKLCAADLVLRPTVNAAAVTQKFSAMTFGKQDFAALSSELRERCDALQQGSLHTAEAMLLSQAHALQSIFTALSLRAANNLGSYRDSADIYLRLAFKAQSQCRATLETLADIKNPTKVAFVRQANIAHTQQVNNGIAATPATVTSTNNPPAHGNSVLPPNELSNLTHEQEQSLDTGTTASASDAHPAMATVDAVHRP